MYADDLVITAENRAEASNRFNSWKTAVEKRGMKVNMEKTKDWLIIHMSISLDI